MWFNFTSQKNNGMDGQRNERRGKNEFCTCQQGDTIPRTVIKRDRLEQASCWGGGRGEGDDPDTGQYPHNITDCLFKRQLYSCAIVLMKQQRAVSGRAEALQTAPCTCHHREVMTRHFVTTPSSKPGSSTGSQGIW